MQLIPAPAGVLEVDALWQQDNPNDPNTDTVALLCHPNPLFDGTMNNKVVTTMYRFARDNGMHVIRFNFRGVGQSTGEHDYADGEVVDAMTVLQWIAEQTSARKLWLGGFSFGGYVTARVAEQVLVSPHIWGLDDFEISKIALIAPSVEKNDSSDIDLPADKTFEIYGNADEVIDPSNMQDFAERLG
ncbi:MAG TPA: alpha/beta hydrolase, partial [Psychrobacter sp.]|nr:alpha/beta hydrolase [Psychrobacter sp.]